ncbi:MAG: phosphatase PAP2 family protein [Afipia sp.]|nr:phosphatase PAP2 family protein [Afipia sp.]
MPASAAVQSASYVRQLALIVRTSFLRLFGAPSHSRRQQARRVMARRWLLLSIVTAVAVGASMFLIDVSAIRLMPPRGSPDLFAVRVFTEFAKSEFVLGALVAALLLVILTLPRLHNSSRLALALFGIRLQYIFFSVLTARIIGELIKISVGRGRPFVGGDANAYNFSPFARVEAYASFPSGHALTAAAMAFAIATLWPRLTVAMWIFTILICVSRVVLLAHHPSDVMAGALVGVIGAMLVRYWFAARHLGFKIKDDGSITPLQQPSWNAVKRVARRRSAP